MKTKTLCFCLLFAVTVTAVHATISGEKRKEIDRMLNLVGMQALADQMMQQMVASFRSTLKDVPADYWDNFPKKFNASEFLERIVPLYDKYYSLEDLRAVNEFYSSKAGQRILKTLPQIMQESMAIGETWGRELGERVVEDARAETLKAELAKTGK